MTVNIGINPITWTNDDMPELGGDIPLETCLAETRQAGYAAPSLAANFPGPQPSSGRSSHAISCNSCPAGSTAASWNASVTDEFAAIEPHLTLLRELGCKVVVYADTSRGRDGFPPISRARRSPMPTGPRYGRKLTALADRMAAFGVRMAFHHHMGTIVESASDIDHLMANSGDAVGLLFDSGHCLFAGGDPAAVLARHIARVVHVHCKDLRRAVLDRALAEDMTFMAAVLEGIFTVPGDGCIDFPPLMRQLHGARYQGWLVVEAEQDPRKAHPLTYASLGHRNLIAMALGAGFEVSSVP